MNKIYRLKFSKRLNQLVAVSEITTGHDRNSGSNQVTETSATSGVNRFLSLKPISALISALSFGLIAQSAMANGLVGMDVVNGSASMTVNGKNTFITNSPDAIINWKQFNINAGELVRFIQENNNSTVFNRVTGDQLSQLKGTLASNGHVFLINPNGIVFGKDSIIDTAGFTASTLNISDKDLKARNFAFEQMKDKAMAAIINNGLITVGKNGSVNLIGGRVQNNGTIKVENGNVMLLAGKKVTISDLVNPTITYSVSAPENKAINLGNVFAKNGKIEINAGAVENQGVLNADSVSKDKSGSIIISAKNGEANIAGTISASNAQGTGGSLVITGKKVTLQNGAHIDLSGKQGGTTYIGGDERGKGKIQLAETTHIKQGAKVNVSGAEKGGKAIIWGDRAQIDGTIIATGKDKASGGFIETSGHYLGVSNTAKVMAKDWLLDPYNVRIVSSGTETNVSTNPMLTITGDDAVILNTTIENALKAGTNVNITTDGAGSQAGTITVEADIVKDAGAEATLTMFANSTFTQNAGTSIKSTADKLNLNVTAANLVLNGTIDTNQGSLLMNSTGNVELNNANISANGTIQMQGAQGRTLKVNGGNFTGTGDNGFNINVTPAADRNGGIRDITGTWSGDITVSGGNVTYSHTATGRQLAGHDWSANLSVNNNGNFNFTERTENGGGDSGVSNIPVTLNISNDIAINTTSGSSANFSVRGYPPQPEATVMKVNGNLTANGEGSVNFNITASRAAKAIQVSETSSLYATGSTVLNLTGDTVSRAALELLGNTTVRAGDTSSINLVGNNNRGLVANNLTIEGNNVNLSGTAVRIEGELVNNANATTISTESGYIFFNGTTTSNKDLKVISNATNGTIEFNGDFNSTANLTVSAPQSGIVQKQGTNITLTGASTDINAGNFIQLDNVTSNQSVNITSTGFKGHPGNVSFSGTFKQEGGALNITAPVVSARDANGANFNGTDKSTISIKTTTLTTETGAVNLHNYTTSEISNRDGGDLTITGANPLNLSGANATLSSSGDRTVKVNTTVNSDSGLNISGNNAEITGNGTLNVTGNLAVTSTDFTNNGTVNATNATFDVTNFTTAENSSINASENVTVNATALTTNGNISGANITLNATDMSIGENATVNATNGTATLKGENITNSGTVVSPNGTIDVDATNNFTNTDTGNLKAKEAVTIDAKEATVGGNVTSDNATVDVNATNVTVSPNATITAKEDVTLNATETLNIGENATVKSTDGDAALKGKDITNSGTVNAANVAVDAVNKFTNTPTGNLVAKENATVNATNADVAGNVSGSNVTLNATGNLTVEEGANINATNGTATLKGENITNSGTVTAENGKIDVDATENFTNTETGNLKAKEVDIDAKAIATKPGSLIEATEKDVNLNATTIVNEGDVNATAGNVNVNATESFVNTDSGNLVAKKDVIVKAKDATVGGSVEGANVTLNTTGELEILEDAAVIANDGNATLKGNNITNSGTVTAPKGSIDVNATENFENTETGNLIAGKDANIAANNAVVAGNVTAAENANITAKNDITVNGNVTGKDVNLNATNNLTTGTNATVNATNGTATLKGENITNSGTVVSPNGTIDVDATNNFTNTDTGNLKAKEAVTIDAKEATVGGNVTSDNATVDVNATNVTVSPNATITAKEDVTLNATETLNIGENATVKSTDGDAALKGKDITNSGTVNAANVAVDAVNKFTNTPTGNLVAKENATVNATNADVAGNVSGSNVTLNTTGNLTVEEGANVNATNGTATLKGENITNSGTVVSPNGTIDVDATNNFTNTDTGNLKAKEAVTIDAKEATVGGNVTSDNATVDVNATNVTVSPNATITAKEDVTLNATETLNIGENATVKSTDGDAALKGKDITNSGTVKAENGTVDVNATNNFTNTDKGNLVAKDAVNVTATNADVDGNVTGGNVTLNTTGNLTVEEGANVNATNGTATLKGENITNSGTVTAENGKIDVDATENFTNTETGNLKAKEVDIDAKAIATKPGSLIEATEKDVNLNATTIVNEGDVNATAGNVNVNATESFVNTDSGNLVAKKDVTVKAKDATVGGSVEGANVTLNTTGELEILKDAAVIANDGNATLKGENITNSGSVVSPNGTIDVNANNMFENTETGNLVAKENVTLAAKDITNAGNVTSENASVNVNATNNFTNTETGNLKAKEDVALKGENITNAGNVTSTDGNVDVNATNFTNTETGNLVAKDAVNVTATNADVDGNITGGNVTLNTTGNLTVKEGANVNATNGTATLKGENITNSGTVVSPNGTIDVDATNNFTNTDTGNLKAKEAVTIDAKEATVGGNVTSDNATVDVNATNVTVSPNATITAKEDVTLNATETLNIGENATVKSTDGDAALKGKDITNSGTVNAANVAVDAVNKFTNTPTGNLVAKENATVNATNADVAGNVSGSNVTLNATGNLTVEEGANVNATNGTATLKGGNITNSGSVVSPNGKIDVNANNTFENTKTGNLVAKENVTLAAKDITNAGNVTSENASVNVNATNNFTNTETGNLKAKEDVALKGENITNAGNVTSTDGNVDVNATNFTNTETGNLVAKENVTLAAKDITNAGNVTSENASVNVNATNNFTNTETGNLKAKEDVALKGENITNAGNVTSENASVNLNVTGNFTNTATGNLKANDSLNINGGNITNNGIIHSVNSIANVNGTIVARGYIGPNYCINGKCGNIDAEMAGQLVRKDTLFDDAMDSQRAFDQEPKASIKGGEITLRRAGEAKTEKLYNNTTIEQEGVSVLSHGSVCFVDNPQSADAQTVNTCVKENSRAQGQYSELFQGKVINNSNQKPATGKALKGR